MNRHGCSKKTLPFALALIIGIFAADTINQMESSRSNTSKSPHTVDSVKPKASFSTKEQGRGRASCSANQQPKVLSICLDYYNPVCTKTIESTKKHSSVKAIPLKIVFKPQAQYTEIARANQVRGTVTLRVSFLANGEIGGVSPVNSLPDGLTESAIAAARNIKFEPAKKDGVTYTVTKQVQYSFSIY